MANVCGIMVFLSVAFFMKYQPIFKKKYEAEHGPTACATSEEEVTSGKG